MRSSVIVSGARTPIAGLLGGLEIYSATALGARAISAALSRGNVAPAEVQYVIMGQVLQAGGGQLTARQAAIRAGIPAHTSALTVNKVCMSGLNAIALADQLIRAGEVDTVVAGGMESMTNAPHLLPASRTGVRYGNSATVDSMAHDGLWDVPSDRSMGELTELLNRGWGITRREQDGFAARSHARAAAAAKNGILGEEIEPVEVIGRGGSIRIGTDEGIRPDTTLAALSHLEPAFTRDGSITAGSTAPLSDGAAAVVVMDKEKARAAGLSWIAEIRGHGMAGAGDDASGCRPAAAIQAALARHGLAPGELNLIEINEAFACVAIQTIRELGLCEDRVNVNGGAIALGHPLGMTGARLVLHLALELQRRGGGIGAATLYGGGGQGDALLLHVDP